MNYARVIPCLLLLALSACGGGGGKSPPPPYPGIKIGKPYEVSGRWYEPQYDAHYDEIGMASWYGPGFHGGHTANGESFDQNAMTAAHRTLPMPSIVRVTNLDTGVSAIVKVNDRGPFAHNRIIDLSKAAAIKLGVYQHGTAKVRVQFLEKETKDYVQNMLNGEHYAMNELKDIDPDEAGEREERGARPTYVPQGGRMFGMTPGGNAPAPMVASRTLPPPPQAASVPDGDEFSVVGEDDSPMLAPHDMNSQQTGYMLQVGTFSQRDNAVTLCDRLASAYPAQIMEVLIGGKKLYRVMVGPYPVRTDAKNMLSKLASIGIPDAKIVHN